MTINEAAKQFLSQPRIAVVGVSRDSKQAANFVFRKLRDSGRRVIPVNPAVTEIEGTTCYPTVKAIPDGVSAAAVFTSSKLSEQIVRECAEAGVRFVWLHRSVGGGSASNDAIAVGRGAKLVVIPSGCPAMFCEPVDFGHKCMRWCLQLTGSIPKEIDA
ncbi:CoA-binding protein [Opitutaceae bacterium EW11]|nr:CoA-binding protein [Opitutaceae bacterium EW11]